MSKLTDPNSGSNVYFFTLEPYGIKIIIELDWGLFPGKPMLKFIMGTCRIRIFWRF